MKRFLLFAAALLLTIPFNVLRADGDEPVEIIIGDGGSMEGGPTHHAPSLIPMSCYYSPVRHRFWLIIRLILAPLLLRLRT